MNKYILGVGAVVLLIIFGLFSSPNNETNSNQQVSSVVSVAADSYDFGEIDIFGGKVQSTYVLKNEGNEDVSITSAVTSCMCTEGEIGGLVFGMHESTENIVVIPAGEEKILTATFDPLAHGPEGIGKIKRELFLKTNSTLTPQIKLTFTGDVIKNED